MFIASKEYFVEVYAVLKLGVDFEKEDLDDMGVVSLKSSKATQIALDNGYLKWSWMGHYDRKTETINIKFQKPVFVDEAAGTVVIR